MPVILCVNGYVFFFYSNEGDPREPTHVHVRSGSGETKIWLEPTVSLDQSKGFNTRQLADIISIATSNRVKLIGAWHEHFGN